MLTHENFIVREYKKERNLSIVGFCRVNKHQQYMISTYMAEKGELERRRIMAKESLWSEIYDPLTIQFVEIFIEVKGILHYFAPPGVNQDIETKMEKILKQLSPRNSHEQRKP